MGVGDVGARVHHVRTGRVPGDVVLGYARTHVRAHHGERGGEGERDMNMIYRVWPSFLIDFFSALVSSVRSDSRAAFRCGQRHFCNFGWLAGITSPVAWRGFGPGGVDGAAGREK